MINIMRTQWTLGAFLLGTLACNNLVGSADLPPGTPDPANYRTPEGALSMYYGAKGAFQTAFSNFLQVSGVFTDELGAVNPSSSVTDERHYANAVTLPYDQLYIDMQAARGATAQAIGALAKYRAADSSTPPLRGEMYSLQAYTELELADLYCSGVPLSTIDFEKDFTYRAGSTTREVYQHAIALFDTALALSADSARLKTLALVGKARALVMLDSLSRAAAMIAAVPTDFQYGFQANEDPVAFQSPWATLSVSDREGLTGLPYRSSGDPRTATIDAPPFWTGSYFISMYYPAKYAVNNYLTPRVVASGVEARLIEAEAQLAAHDPAWLMTLNTLRTTGTYASIDTVVVSIDESVSPPDTTFRIDTTWVAGTGGVGHLGPSQDPGSDSARVTLLFNERAKWLFLTGHRQGDLRRLVRVYHRRQQDVYPSIGQTLAGHPYGSDVTVPVNAAQERANPLFKGCFNSDA